MFPPSLPHSLFTRVKWGVVLFSSIPVPYCARVWSRRNAVTPPIDIGCVIISEAYLFKIIKIILRNQFFFAAYM